MAARQEALAKQAAEAIAQERARIQEQAQKKAQQAQQAQQAIEVKEAETEQRELTNEENADETAHPDAVRAEKRVGRNDLCPCGSGKKYKNCCLRKDEQ